MTHGAARPRVFLVDDHPAVCLGLRLLFEQNGLQVCGDAGDVARALSALRDAPADLVVVDLTLGAEDGLELLRRLAKEAPGARVLVYSMHEDATRVRRALEAGARAYVTKRESPELVLTAASECLAGRAYVSPRAAQGLAHVPGSAAAVEPLSQQELKVYELLGEGFSVAEIAQRLAVGRRTVETYFVRIQTKLGLQGMRELRRHAVARRP